MPWSGQPLLHVSKPGVVPSDYVKLLGSNLVALWHRGQGVSLSSGTNISGWTDVVSNRALTLSGGAAPQYAADGTHFGGKSVVQCSAGAAYFNSATATLIAAGAKPFVFCISRWRDATGNYPYQWYLNESQDMVHFTAGIGGQQLVQFKQPGIVYGPGGQHDTQVHYQTSWLDGTLGHYTKDASDFTVAGTGSISPAIDKVYLSNGVGNPSFYLWGLCSAAPSAGERAALYALMRNDAAIAPRPSDILSGLIVTLDPAQALITGGAVETFYGYNNVTQATAIQRATYAASDAAFNGQPSAAFVGYNPGNSNEPLQYALPNLSALTQGEVFAVLKNNYQGSWPNGNVTGLWNFSTSGTADHHPYSDNVLYDAFGTTVRKTAGSVAALNLTQAHIYNARSQSGLWECAFNGGATFYTTGSNTVGFPAAPTFGKGDGSFAFNGELGLLAFCNKVQTADARAAFIAYLKTRFAIA